MSKVLLTTAEAAEHLGVSTARVRQLVIDGRLPATKFGRDLVIDAADLASIEKFKPGPKPKPKAAANGKAAKKKRARKGA
jgi:excisionase family DNA binding protein